MNHNDKIVITPDRIYFEEHPERFIMMDWEDPLMKKHAEVVCQDGGHIIEIGFGLGISANYIQQHDIQSHTIIEIHDDVYELLLDWAKDKENVIPIKGDWFDISNQLELHKYDGIFYDGYGGVNEMKIKDFAINHLKSNGIFTHFNLSGADIFKLGDRLNIEKVNVMPSIDCNYCGHNHLQLTEVCCPWVRLNTFDN
jgi:protein arginine N-methyltransferase 2